MGYVTTEYSLHVFSEGKEINLSSPFNRTLDADIDRVCSQSDLSELSRRYPRVLFVLDMRGKNEMDWIREYYLDGQIQIEKAKVVVGECKLEEGM